MQTTVMRKVKAIVAMLMMISVVYTLPTVSAENGGGLPRIMVVPESIVDLNLTPGKNFTVSIYTDYNGSDITAWQFSLSYNSSVLNGGKNKTETWTGDGSKKKFYLTEGPVAYDSVEVYVNGTPVTERVQGYDLWIGDGETGVFTTSKKPIVEESEEIYVNSSLQTRRTLGRDTWTGDGSTKTFYTTGQPVVQYSEMVQMNFTDTWSAGKNQRTYFTTVKPVIAYSEEVYVDGVLMIQPENYTINYATGNITFTFTPQKRTPIKATYKALRTRDTDYTIDHATGNMTFTDPPAAGTIIEAEYLYGHYTIIWDTGIISFETQVIGFPGVGAIINATYLQHHHTVDEVKGTLEFTTANTPGVGAQIKVIYLYGGVTNGDLITGEDADFIPGAFNNTAGTLELTGGEFFYWPGDPIPVTSGPGTLANVTFRVVGYGCSDITIGIKTKLIGWNGSNYDIIDAETMPDQIRHGFFANIEGKGSAGSNGGATARAEGHANGANGLEAQAEATSITLHLALPDITIGWYWAWELKTFNGYYSLIYRAQDAVKPGQRYMLHAAIAAHAIKDELKKIGIDVKVHLVDKYVWMNFRGYSKKTYEEGGWDMALLGWDGVPTDLLGYESMYTKGSYPPFGGNYFDWQNEEADIFLWRGMQTLDATERRDDLRDWQETFMHDPPAIPLYYLEGWDVTNKSLEGWDPVVGWADGWNLSVQGKTPEDDVTIKWGSRCDRGLNNLNPLFASTDADYTYAAQTFETLMKLEKDPETDGYKLVPWLARDYPTYSADGKTVTVHVRENVTWHEHPYFANNYTLNNRDVELTFDALRKFGYGSYTDIIESIDINGQYEVVFHLNEPYAAFETLLSQVYILPRHLLGNLTGKYGYDWDDWKKDPMNTDPDKRMSGTGPFEIVERTTGFGWEMKAVENYWNWMDQPMVDHIYCFYLPDSPSAFQKLKDHEIDFGDCWFTTNNIMQQIIGGNGTWYNLKALPDRSPTLDYLAFNLNHEVLSNRYVRQAIAHAINYPLIFSTLMSPYPYVPYSARAPVFPIQQYTDPNGQTVFFFNDDLDAYECDITKAQRYMNMWNYSRVGKDYTKGPVGDANFNGFVDMIDYHLWIEWFGKQSHQVTFKPGQDVDPDFDNNGWIEPEDFPKWAAHYSYYYPEASKTHVWSR